MEQIIEGIARSIVFDEDDLTVEAAPGMYQTRVTLRASSRDVGKLLGRHGKTVTAMRFLTDLIAEKNGSDPCTIWVEGSV